MKNCQAHKPNHDTIFVNLSIYKTLYLSKQVINYNFLDYELINSRCNNRCIFESKCMYSVLYKDCTCAVNLGGSGLAIIYLDLLQM